MALEFRKESVEAIEGLIDGKLERANEFNDTTGFWGSETFFEFANAVAGFAGIREILDTVKIVNLEFMFGGVFNHVPLDGILGVVFFHVFFVAAGVEINDLVAVKDEHGD